MYKKLLTLAACLWLGLQVAMAQGRPVKGQILDEKGEGIPGASITVKGTTVGTITDVDGNFTIDVPDEKNALLVNAIGYGTQEVQAGDGSKTISVKMATSSKVLDETVVTALNIKREKKALGYSVSEVNADLIEKSGERNAIQSLAAKAPGIQVTSSAGVPGASSKIRIRGNSTFTGSNEPLVVVDGVPIDNSTAQPTPGDYPFNMNLQGVNESNRALDINPDDIESVSVLKGPAAASLYGQRGANGAIIITTKKGRYGKGSSLGITLTSSVEMNKVNKLPKMQDKYGQGSGGKYVTGTTPLSWGPRLDTANLPTYNNFDNFFKTGLGFNNTIAINGGNENAIFRVSFGNYNSTGIIPNSKLARTTVNLSGEAKLASWLTAGAVANYTYTEGRRVQNGSNIAGTMLSLFRMPVTYDVTKDYYDPVQHKSNNYFSSYDNPLFTVYRNPYTDYTNRILGNVYFNANITDGLSLSYKLGTDVYTTQTKQIYDLGSRGNDAANGIGQLNRSTNSYMQVYSDLILKYNKRFGDIDVNAFAGYNYWYQESRFNFLRGSDQAVPDLYNLDAYKTLYAYNSESYIRSQAVFAEANFGYKSFLYLTLTGRNEWSTPFGKGAKSFFYPKADISWVFSEHIPQNDILSFGKARVAFSKAGVAPSVYSNRNYYTKPFITDGFTNGNGFPYLGEVGYMPPNINHPGDLRPETVTGTEFGVELRLWKNKVSFEGTFYNQISNDLILNKPVAPSSGYQYEYINAGKMRNRGVELSLDYNVFKNKDWDVHVGANWAKNVNEVLALDNDLKEISLESGFESIGSYAIVGQPYGVFYGSAWQRDDQGRLLIGSNGLPLVTAQSQRLGNPNPDWLMGINGSVSYKGFTFSMLWDIRKGGDVWNGTWARLNNVGRADQTADRDRTYIIDGVNAPGTPNEGKANTTPVSAVNYFRYYNGDLGATENAIQDGGWIRLRSVGLSYRYSFKKHEDSKNPFNYIEVGVTGRNLFLSTKYKGVDPETSLTGAGSNLGGWDYFNNPGSKSYILNLKLGL